LPDLVNKEEVAFGRFNSGVAPTKQGGIFALLKIGPVKLDRVFSSS